MTPIEWLIAAAVLFVGAAVQGGLGFGMNLIAAPLLLLLDPRLVPGPSIGTAVVLTALVASRDREGMDLADVRWAFLGRLPGTLLAVMAIAVLSQHALSITFGLLVLAAVALTAGGLDLPLNRPTLVGAGALSGFMGTTTSIGGPPMAVVFQRESGLRLRGTLSGFFLAGSLLSLSLLAVVGRFGLTEIALTLGLLPGLLAGYAVSGAVARHLDAGRIRLAVLGVSAASAIAVVVTELL